MCVCATYYLLNFRKISGVYGGDSRSASVSALNSLTGYVNKKFMLLLQMLVLSEMNYIVGPVLCLKFLGTEH